MGIGGIHEVVMGLFSAAEVDLFDQAGLHQMVECAVDGGFGDAKIAFAEFQEQFLGSTRLNSDEPMMARAPAVYFRCAAAGNREGFVRGNPWSNDGRGWRWRLIC